MPRLTLTLPDELRRGRDGSENTRRSRRLGDGIEGADDTSQRVLRWMDCWTRSDD